MQYVWRGGNVSQTIHQLLMPFPDNRLRILKNVKLIDGLVKSDNYASNMVNIVYFLMYLISMFIFEGFRLTLAYYGNTIISDKLCAL